jgi:sigma-B regulation protein RsbU (phosphoserine phosphatase)
VGTTILERIRAGLLEKRVGLAEWLSRTPPTRKEVLLGPSTEQAVRAQVASIDDSIREAEAGTLGICKVCHEYVEPDLLEIDYTADVCIAHLSEDEVRHLEAELELAQRVQKALLPQEAPNVAGLETAAFSRPAQIVGGDYFDFIELGGGIHCLAIADVAGHGVSASLHMASVQAMLRAIVTVTHSPADVIKQMHKLFIHNIRFTTFVTIFVGTFNSASKTLTYCNAGHNPPMVLQKRGSEEGSVAWLNPTGAAIGLVDKADFGEDTLALHEDDLLVMYTDGVTEAQDPQNDPFGRERLVAMIEQLHQSPAKEVVSGIIEGLERFRRGEPLVDDTTVVVCRIT